MSAEHDAKVREMFEEGRYTLARHDQTRRVIAQRLVQSKTTVPHFYVSLDCDLGALLALRATLNGARDAAQKVSVNDFIVKALALALLQVPAANVTWTDEAMLLHRACDIGVAVAIPGGLVAPIVRDADAKSVHQLSAEIKDMAARAQNRRLRPDEYRGGTSSVSNLGMFGVREAQSIVNPPQATILAVGAAQERAVVRDGRIEVATMVTTTLSCDHRAVDGAVAAQLLAALRTLIEQPSVMVD